MSVRFLAAALTVLAAAPLAAQQDTGMMAHDTGMMADTGMMNHDAGMMKEPTESMSSDSAMMDHGMGSDDAMEHGGSMMFTGTGGAKASGDYEIAENGGRQRLTLTGDFVVAEAPDLYLLLSAGPTDRNALTLGKLKQPAAGQSFELPKGKDLSRYTTLVVWSKKDKRAVATAEWHAPDAMRH